MELTQIAEALGIANYPPELNEIYAAGNLCDPCDPALLDTLEARYGLLGQYYDAVRQAMLALPSDPNRYAWAKVVSTYIGTVSVGPAGSVRMPVTDGTPVGDLLPVMIPLTQIPQAVKTYSSKGFTEEQITEFLSAFGRSIAVVKKSVGRPALNQLYYWWLCLYAKASIFHCGGFHFELYRLPNEAIYLQNRDSGELVPVMASGIFHRSGQVLGSGGCADEAGSFPATIRETDAAWYGIPATECAAAKNEVCFPKSQWTCVLQPKDTVLSMHIPAGTDLSPEAVDAAIQQAMVIARRSYPEWTRNGIYCRSWLLDPVLSGILGADAKISRFGAKFYRHPIKSNGRSGFNNVFPGCSCADEDLPENTRLQKGLKTHFLSGGYLYGCAGAFIAKNP